MIIKLLNNQVTAIKESVEVSGTDVVVEFDVKTVDSALQARLLDKATRIKDAESRLVYFKEQVKCIENDTIKVNGDDVSASQLAEIGDFTHEATGAVIGLVSKQIDKVVFLDDEEIKK